MKYMNFEAFVNKVKENLEEYLPEELKGAEENNKSVLGILHAHERNIGTGGGCLL